VLAAVPDAAEIGLLDLPPDRAELMAAQAGRFGQAGLTRAAEIVSTGLDQMRGATSPRLLLELMCAQVLLPAAASDEKSLLARLERLEKATPQAPLPQSPPRAPHSGPDVGAERSRGPRPAERQAPEPARTPASPQPAPPSQPAPARPAPVQRPPARRAPEPPVREKASPGPAEPAGSATAASLRQNWDAILEAVKQERRATWWLLSNASVLSLDGAILTLGFPRDGELKGFSASGHDAILKQVLSARFGLTVTVRAVPGGDAAPGAAGLRPGRSDPGPASPPAPVRRDPAPAPPEFVPPEFAGSHDEPPDDLPPDEMPPDEPSPDDRAVRAAELTGMDLIQRELGGQVIGEIEG
jgi:DNA polymerase III subunit gamma/tau